MVGGVGTVRRTVLSVEIPIKTVSELNRREHWASRARRVKAQRAATMLALRCCRVQPREEYLGAMTIRVLLVRVGPRRLDGDNLQGALKAVRDAVAEWIGIDDGDPIYEWIYAQETGKPASVRIHIGKPDAFSKP